MFIPAVIILCSHAVNRDVVVNRKEVLRFSFLLCSSCKSVFVSYVVKSLDNSKALVSELLMYRK